MTNQENEMIFRRWVNEVWNERRESAIDELFAEDGIATCPNTPTNEPVCGIENFKLLFRRRQQTFLTTKLTIEQLISEGSKVTAYCRFNGVRRDESLTDAVRRVEIFGLYVARITAGKMAVIWHDLDLKIKPEKLMTLCLIAFYEIFAQF